MASPPVRRPPPRPALARLAPSPRCIRPWYERLRIYHHERLVAGTCAATSATAISSIPTMKRPSPPVIPPRRSIMAVSSVVLVLSAHERVVVLRAANVVVASWAVVLVLALGAKELVVFFGSVLCAVVRGEEEIVGVQIVGAQPFEQYRPAPEGGEIDDDAFRGGPEVQVVEIPDLGKRTEVDTVLPVDESGDGVVAVTGNESEAAVAVGAVPACTALSSTRSFALSPSTMVISVLQPAEPMSCLVLSVQPVRMPVRDTTPGSPSRGRWDICSLRALGGLTTRERAHRMRAILPSGVDISGWLFFWFWTELNSGYGVIDFGRAPYPHRAAVFYRNDRSRAPAGGRDSPACRRTPVQTVVATAPRRQTQPLPRGAGPAAGFPGASLFRVSARSQSRNARAAGLSCEPGATARK